MCGGAEAEAGARFGSRRLDLRNFFGCTLRIRLEVHVQFESKLRILDHSS